ncbi:unnamed protein product [Fraxinus pennsylvanica]|uniref:Uncharacterized protein n=1 Tax=Fraxinus pennsylvanica TaxID=56036 RepID=A0AAD1Z0Q2_9LAMI|nr:unnamed protein product [Fraxinus pennsylvanica]
MPPPTVVTVLNRLIKILENPFATEITDESSSHPWMTICRGVYGRTSSGTHQAAVTAPRHSRLHHTSFGVSSSSPKPSGRTGVKVPGTADAEPGAGQCTFRNHSEAEAPKAKLTKSDVPASFDGGESAEKVDAVAAMMYPPPRLGQFYDFFSFSHITPPVQYIRRSTRPFHEDKTDDDFFQIDVRICSGKPTTIVASRKGFYPSGKCILLSHSLVGLLQQISRIFDSAYKALTKAFTEHNKFGNLPYGFRANTWLVPPIVAEC